MATARSSTTATAAIPLIVCGPSGVGKGTLLARLFTDFSALFGKKISHTTRAPRSNEVDGKDYYFVTRAEFEKGIEQGEFIEHARVHNNIYGTTLASVQHIADTGRVCVLELDVQGAEIVLASRMKAHFCFIYPPSVDTLRERLQGRGTEDSQAIQVRLDTAKKELNFAEQHKDIFAFTLINDDIEQAYSTFVTHLINLYPQFASQVQKASTMTSVRNVDSAL